MKNLLREYAGYSMSVGFGILGIAVIAPYITITPPALFFAGIAHILIALTLKFFTKNLNG